jgi:hypothetical protein
MLSRLAPLSLAMFTLLAACAPEDGSTEDTGQAVSTTQPSRDTDVDVGFGIRRPMHIDFGTSCLEWDWKVLHKGGHPERYCKRSGLDDSVWKTAKIFKDATARANNWIFPAARSCGVSCVAWADKPNPKGYGPRVRYCTKTAPNCLAAPYRGCGPAAVANVLNFYGVELSTVEVADTYVETFQVPFTDQIASTPDAVASGLQRLLDERADGIFTVTRKSWVDVRSEVQAAIKRGTPIIVLVNNGGHYVTVTGYQDWSLFSVTDYLGSERQVNDWDLGFDVLTGDLAGWVGGYLPNTVITVERRPR